MTEQSSANKHAAWLRCGAVLLLACQTAHSQQSPVVVTLDPESATAFDHLPIQLPIVVSNTSSSGVVVLPYRLSEAGAAVPRIRFESSSLTSRGSSIHTNGMVPMTRVPPGGKAVIPCYLQDYFERLPVGRHSIVYSIDWDYRLLPLSAKEQGTVHASGTFAITITQTPTAAVRNYLDQRIASIRTSVEWPRIQAAVREIELIDDPMALEAGPALLKARFGPEVLTLAQRFSTPASNRLLEELVSPSEAPSTIQACLATLVGRGIPPSVFSADVVRALLTSSNVATQVIGLRMVSGENAHSLTEPVNSLAQSPDSQVRKAATEALKRAR